MNPTGRFFCAGLILCFSVFFVASIVGASTLDGSGLAIQLIDGNSDVDTTVAPQVSDYQFGASYNVYYRYDAAAWSLISFTGGKATLPAASGGTLLDFALDYNGSGGIGGTGDLYSYKDFEATITYSSTIPAINAFQPSRTSDYFRQVDVFWDGVGGGSFVLDILVPTGASNDGFAPVPIPSALLLLGSGIFGLVAIGSKMRGKA